MAFDFLRRGSLLTHGLVGWWWASRHAYPADEHGVRVPVYGWVAAEVAEAAVGAGTQASLPAPELAAVPDARPAIALPQTGDRIAAFPNRA